MPKVAQPPLVRETGYVHPVMGGGLGDNSHCAISDAGGLTQFGKHLEVLHPGSRSSFRHWHTAQDEMVFMLSGEVVLIETTETLLVAGDAACWPAGSPVAHCLENRSASDATDLIVGTRRSTDVIHYPDHDHIAHKDGPARRYTHGDGRPRNSGETP